MIVNGIGIPTTRIGRIVDWIRFRWATRGLLRHVKPDGDWDSSLCFLLVETMRDDD